MNLAFLECENGRLRGCRPVCGEELFLCLPAKNIFKILKLFLLVNLVIYSIQYSKKCIISVYMLITIKVKIIKGEHFTVALPSATFSYAIFI